MKATVCVRERKDAGRTVCMCGWILGICKEMGCILSQHESFSGPSVLLGVCTLNKLGVLGKLLSSWKT